MIPLQPLRTFKGLSTQVATPSAFRAFARQNQCAVGVSRGFYFEDGSVGQDSVGLRIVSEIQNARQKIIEINTFYFSEIPKSLHVAPADAHVVQKHG